MTEGPQSFAATQLPSLSPELPKSDVAAKLPHTEPTKLDAEPTKLPEADPPKIESASKVATGRKLADWDYKSKRAEMWEAGKRIFSREFSMKTPDLKGDSRVLAVFDGVGRVEVAGVWFWMTQVSNQRATIGHHTSCPQSQEGHT